MGIARGSGSVFACAVRPRCQLTKAKASEADLRCRLITPAPLAFFFGADPEAVDDDADSDDGDEIGGGGLLLVFLESTILSGGRAGLSSSRVRDCDLLLRVERNEEASMTPWRILPPTLLSRVPAMLRRRAMGSGADICTKAGGDALGSVFECPRRCEPGLLLAVPGREGER